MKKANNTRISKKLLNFPTEASLTLQLNKSLPSLAEFLDLYSNNSHIKDLTKGLKEATPTTDQNFKLRTNTKAPGKRLALLLDAYSDRNVKKQHHTVDTLEASSRENSVKSPQNINGSLRKSSFIKHSGPVSNFKGTEFLKSREFSKLAVSKVLGRGVQKPSGLGKVNKHDSEIYESQNERVLLSREETEEAFPKNATKKATKTLEHDDKKIDNRNEHPKKMTKLRRVKLAYNDLSLGERVALNSSQPQTTKNQTQVVHSIVTSGSPLFRQTAIPVRTKNKVKGPHLRLSNTPKHSEIVCSINADDSSIEPRSKEREKEKHKKTRSTSLISTGSNVPRTSVCFLGKDLSRCHRKGISGVSGIGTKRLSDTERELLLQFPVDHSKGAHSRLPMTKFSGSTCENLLSEPTTRHGEDSEQGSRQLILHGKGGDKTKAKGGNEKDPDSNMCLGLESFAKLEIAFSAFLEDHLRKSKEKMNQDKLERIIKAWNGFLHTLGIQEKNKQKEINSKETLQENNETKNKKKIGTEPKVKLSGSDLEKPKVTQTKKGRISTSPNQLALMTAAAGKSVTQENNIQAKDEEHEKGEESIEREELQQIVEDQQNAIGILQKNEERLMKLISAIKKQGYDIDKIYKDQVKKTGDDFLQQYEPLHASNHEKDVVQLGESQMEERKKSSMRESVNMSTPERQGLKVVKNGSDTKSTTDSTPFPTGGTISHNRLNPVLKNKLRLDFTGINPNAKGEGQVNAGSSDKAQADGTKADNQDNNEEPHGFHEEFMSKIEEFSLSWRQAAMNQRNL